MFLYNSTHQVVVCRTCKSCIIPGRRSQERHLQARPHQLSGSVLKETVQLLSSYDLWTLAELREYKPQPGDKCQLLEHLASYSGFSCLQPQCSYCTRDLGEMKKHVASIHKTKAAEHKGESALWDECQLQTYFTRKGRIDYFVVVVVAAAAAAAAAKPQEAKGRSRHAQDYN